METKYDTAYALLEAWSTCNAVTIFLVKNLPDELWEEKVPGYPRKTIQMIGGHLHNTRCMWIKNTGKKLGVDPPEHVDRYHISRKDLISALSISSDSILKLLRKSIKHQKITGFSLDTVHFQNYLVAHEAHHCGQITIGSKTTGISVVKGNNLWPVKMEKTQEKYASCSLYGAIHPPVHSALPSSLLNCRRECFLPPSCNIWIS